MRLALLLLLGACIVPRVVHASPTALKPAPVVQAVAVEVAAPSVDLTARLTAMEKALASGTQSVQAQLQAASWDQTPTGKGIIVALTAAGVLVTFAGAGVEVYEQLRYGHGP